MRELRGAVVGAVLLVATLPAVAQAGQLVELPRVAHVATAPSASDPCPDQSGVATAFALGTGQASTNSSGQVTNVSQAIGIGSPYALELTSLHQCWNIIPNSNGPATEASTSGSLDVNGVWLVPISGNPEILVSAGDPNTDANGTEIEALGSNADYYVEVPQDGTDPQNVLGTGQNQTGQPPEASSPLVIVGQVNLGSDNGTPWTFNSNTTPRPDIGSFERSSSSQAITYGPLQVVGGEVTDGVYSNVGEATVEVDVPLPSVFTLGPSGGGTPTAAFYYYAINTNAQGLPSGGGGGGSDEAGGGGNLPPPTPQQILCQETSGDPGIQPKSCNPVKYMQWKREPAVEQPLAHAGSLPSGPLTFNVPSAYLGGLPINDLVITYNPNAYTSEGGEWSGNGSFEIAGYGAAATIDVTGNGQIIGGTIQVNGDIPVIPQVIDITELDGSLFPDRPTVIGGGATVKVFGGSLLSIPGCFEMVFADQNSPYDYNPSDMSHNGCQPPAHLLYGGPITSFALGVAGTDSLNVPLLGSVPLGSGYGFYIAPSYFEFGGNFNENLVIFNVNGGIDGALDTANGDYNLTGNLSVCLPDGIGCGSLGAIVSNKGVGACGNVKILGVTTGVWFTYFWGASLPSFGFGCNDQGVAVAVASAAPAPGSPTTIQIPSGVPVTSITVTARRHAPLVEVTGPGGQTASNISTSGAVSSDGITIVPLDAGKETVIGISNPAPGSWTITPLAASDAITGVSYRDGIAAPRVTASVSHHGASYLLHYAVRRRPAQAVEFVEEAPHVFHVLGTSAARSGTISFKPTLSPQRQRTIVALVSLGRLPNHDLTVAHYTAPADPRAGKAGHLKIGHSRGELVVSWSPGSNTESSLVTVILSDGRKLLFNAGKGTGSVTVPDVGGAVSAEATITGIGPDGSLGSPAIARVGTSGVPGPVKGLRTATGPHGIVVRWDPASGAASYRVHVRLADGSQLIAVSTKPYLPPSRALAALRRGDSATIVVRAASSVGIVGKPGVFNYAP